MYLVASAIDHVPLTAPEHAERQLGSRPVHVQARFLTAPGGFFFWTRFHNLVVFDGENCACAKCIAKQRYIRGNSFDTEYLGILEYSSMTVAGESLLSLYKNSYTVQLLSCFYNLAWETGSE